MEMNATGWQTVATPHIMVLSVDPWVSLWRIETPTWLGMQVSCTRPQGTCVSLKSLNLKAGRSPRETSWFILT